MNLKQSGAGYIESLEGEKGSKIFCNCTIISKNLLQLQTLIMKWSIVSNKM